MLQKARDGYRRWLRRPLALWVAILIYEFISHAIQYIYEFIFYWITGAYCRMGSICSFHWKDKEDLEP